MKCPDCAVDLEGVEHKAMHLDTCSQCSGMWLAPPILAKLVPVLESEGAKALPFAGASQRCCPTCGINMSLIAFKGVELDFCGACHGVWFDKDELGSSMAKKKSGMAPAMVAATAALAAGGVAAASMQPDPVTGTTIVDKVTGVLGDTGSAIVGNIDLGDVVGFVGNLLVEVISGILE